MTRNYYDLFHLRVGSRTVELTHGETPSRDDMADSDAWLMRFRGGEPFSFDDLDFKPAVSECAIYSATSDDARCRVVYTRRIVSMPAVRQSRGAL